MIVGQKIGAGEDVVRAAPNVGLFAKEGEAGHGDEDGLGVDAPQVHEKHHLKSHRFKTIVFRKFSWIFAKLPLV